MPMLTRGKLARSAGVHSETIRYYERMGLLKEPARTPSGYRQYDADTLQRLIFIKHAQTLGFSLSEICELLALQFDAHLNCDYLRQKTQVKVDAINTRIAALTALREALLDLARRCDTDCACGANCTALIAVAKSR